ncbi:hypothetical protein, partial [Nonomuraea sp. KM90]|uniref:hypothetical protein n=1 Tax=Nonomuraea sp. KM90 TaxID=3457428 RepID=UPI003FCCCF9D
MTESQALLTHAKPSPIKRRRPALAIAVLLSTAFAALVALPSMAIAAPTNAARGSIHTIGAPPEDAITSPTPTPSGSGQDKGDVGVLYNCGVYTNQPMTRSQALVRAKSWIDARVPYSQAACHSNQYGSYRTDCSGFVSMAWGLSRSYTTFDIHLVSHTIARADLQPGDALNDADSHMALFVRWDDAARTRPVVREQAGPDGSPTAERVWSAAYASGYTPIRYNNIRDDAPPAVRESSSAVVYNGELTFFGLGFNNRLDHWWVAPGSANKRDTW